MHDARVTTQRRGLSFTNNESHATLATTEVIPHRMGSATSTTKGASGGKSSSTEAAFISVWIETAATPAPTRWLLGC